MAVRIPDLAELIAENRGEGKAVTTSFKDLSAAAGGEPTTTRFHQYRKLAVVDPATGRSELKEAPQPQSVRGIAQALGVSEWAVWRSVAVSLGFKVPPAKEDVPLYARLDRLPVENLTPAEVDTLVSMAKTLLANR